MAVIWPTFLTLWAVESTLSDVEDSNGLLAKFTWNERERDFISPHLREMWNP